MNWKELYALVNENIKNAVSGLYKPAGDVTFAELPELSQSVLGYTYTVTDAFTTDNRFTDYDTETQAGHSFPADTEVAVIVTGTTENPVYMFNVMGGIMDGYATKGDLDNYVEKESGKSLSTNDYTDADKALVQDSPITVSATGSNLTLSTSAGNIGALTVYGKSEVVDNEIVSAGDSGAITVTTDDGTTIGTTTAAFTTGTPLRGIPNTSVRDVMQWDGSAGTVTKNCGVITLNGGETWRVWTGTAFYCNLTMAKAVTVTNDQLPHLLSYLSAQTATDIFEQNVFGINVSNDTIRIRIENINNTSDLQAYLQANPLTIVYELATPTTEQLTTAENDSIAGLRTFTPQTHAQNNAGAAMTVEAYAGTANGKAVNELKQDVQSEISALKITQSDTLTLTTAGWTNNAQTVTYAHDTAKRNVIDVDPSSVEEWASCGILATAETASGITFTCKTVPENALTFRVTSMGVN